MARLSKREQLHQDQGGLCAYCRRPLSLRGSHRHDLVPREGGPIGAVEDLVLVHPRCHIKVHKKKVQLRKPAAKKRRR